LKATKQNGNSNFEGNEKTNKNNTLAVDATLNNIQQKMLKTFLSGFYKCFLEKNN
jgi:hypothetical protein